MERNIDSLIGWRLIATDGEVGKVDDLYFDDDSWTIRYLIINMEEGAPGRKVLIAPVALLKDQSAKGMFFVGHTKAQIHNSPDIDTAKPVSRQQEIELYGHYAWKGYWDSGFYAGGLAAPPEDLPATARLPSVDLYLRSTRFVNGFHVHGESTEVGYICDFILDDQTWKIGYIVVDTRPFRGKKKLLVPVLHVVQMRWNDSEVYLDEKEAAIDKSEVFEPAAFTDLPTSLNA